MTVTKVTSKFTEEERAVLKKIYKIRAQMQKDMEGIPAKKKSLISITGRQDQNPGKAAPRSALRPRRIRQDITPG
jgi:hypothetical protein